MASIFVVPYITEESKAVRASSSEVEKAVVLCLAEINRKKPKIPLLNPEEIVCIAKNWYPLWVVPWKDKCIVIDGLGLSSVEFSHREMPDVLMFTEELQKGSAFFTLFRETLEKHIQTFKGFISTKKVVLGGVLSGDSVLKSIATIITQGTSLEEMPMHEDYLILSKVPKEESERKTEKVIGEWQKLHTEIAALEYAINTLKEGAGYQKEKFSIDIEQTWRNYELRISEMKKQVEIRIKETAKLKGEEIKKTVKIHEKELNTLLREKKKLEKTVERFTRVLEESRSKREYQRRKYAKRSTARLDEKIEFYRRKVAEIIDKLRNISKREEELRREWKEDLKKVEEKYQSLVAKETEKLDILQESRNMEISKKRGSVKELEKNASVIEAQIKELIEKKNNAIKELEKVALSFKLLETILIVIPFYFVEYKTPEKTRITVYPPIIIASHDSVIKKIQRALFSFNLGARLQLFLKPLLEILNETIFKKLEKKIELDSTLREEVSRIGYARNLLKTPNFIEEVTKGMEEFEAKGWINTQERDSILSLYAHE